MAIRRTTTLLGEFVYDLQVGCPTEIVEWGTENEIFNVWSTVEAPDSVSANGILMVGC